jgi:hypothetical protein
MNYQDILIVNRILNQALNTFKLTPRETLAIRRVTVRSRLRASWGIQTSSREDLAFAGSALSNRLRRKQTSPELASKAGISLALEKKLKERTRYRYY